LEEETIVSSFNDPASRNIQQRRDGTASQTFFNAIADFLRQAMKVLLSPLCHPDVVQVYAMAL
jgi:hypothetical protein